MDDATLKAHRAELIAKIEALDISKRTKGHAIRLINNGLVARLCNEITFALLQSSMSGRRSDYDEIFGVMPPRMQQFILC